MENRGNDVQPARGEDVLRYWQDIKHGDNSAVVNLAWLLKESGSAAEPEWKRAKHLYRKAFEDGNVCALCTLGYLLLIGGKRLDVDPGKAIPLYRKAVEDDDTDAMFGLAVLLQEGAEGLAPDLTEAISLYRRACKEKHAFAMFHLGNLLLDGEGVEQDLQEAEALFRESARCGNAMAMNRLASLLMDGCKRIKRDVPEALRWFGRATGLGYYWAVYEMGWSFCYRNTEKQPWPERPCLTVHRDATGTDAQQHWGEILRGLDGGDKELKVVTRFEGPGRIPNSVIGILIAHIHRTRNELGSSKEYHAVAASMFGEDALVVRTQNDSGVLVRLKWAHKRLEWKFRGSEPVGVAKEFLTSIEGEADTSSSFTDVPHTYLITLDRDGQQKCCGASKSGQIKLKQKWLSEAATSATSEGSGSAPQLPSHDFVCGECDAPWSWTDVQKSLWPVNEGSSGGSTVLKGVSQPPQFDVFISHAGPDKFRVARPIKDGLEGHGVRTFLDCDGLQILHTTAPEEMERAMEQASIGVFILSPEFAAKKWPMKELRCFLDRDMACKRNGRPRPVLLPIFYRLSLQECTHCESRVYGQNSKHREVLRKEKFFDEERQKLCSTEKAIQALKTLSTHSGIEKKRIGGGQDLLEGEITMEAVRRIRDYKSTHRREVGVQ